MKKNVLVSLFVAFLSTIMGSFLFEDKKIVNKKEKLKINITTMGNVKESDLNLVSNELIKFYDAEIVFLPKTNIIKESKVMGLNKYDGRVILKDIDKTYPNKEHKILILTDYDICTDRKLNGVVNKNWGIFGLALLNKKPCITSTHRMGKEYKDRLIKVSIHEVGHTLGIPHCENTKCIMTDAKGKGSTVDNASIWMCEGCKSKIKY